MFRYSFPIINVLLILTFCLPAATANSADIAKEIENQQRKIKKVQEEIKEHRERVLDTRIKETNLFEQLEVIDQAINKDRKKLTGLKERMAEQERMIDGLTEELTKRQAEKDEVRKHVEERLGAFYRMGDLGVMNVTFSAGSLPDLLNFKEYFKSLVKYDQKVIYDYRLKIEKLQETRRALEEEKAELLENIATVKKQEINLKNIRSERVALLTRINTEKKLYRRAIEEMEEASTELTETLANLREKLVTKRQTLKGYYSSPKKRRPGSPRAFSTMKGKLSPPVRGSVTTFFGKSKQGKFGITTQSDGIDIKTFAGNEIKAIYNGKVVYAGPLKGYGNLIVIDHGYQYYSVISRASELYKKEGDSVSTGEAIGVMGDNGGLLGEGLHFEIRHGTRPLDPLEWVNRKLLSNTEPLASLKGGKKKTKNN